MRHPENPSNLTIEAETPSALLDVWLARYGHPLYRFALGLIHHPQVSEEIVQDVLVQAWRTHQRHPRQILSAAWFYQVARNRCRDYQRKQGRNQALQERVERAYRPPSIDDADRLATSEDVHQVLRQLSHADQLCLWLFYFGGWAIPDIAVEMGSSPDAVKTRLARARRRFRHLWQEDDDQ